MAGKRHLRECPRHTVLYSEQGIYGVVGETPLIRGCRSLILNELVIKMTGKNSYEIEYHQNVGQAVKKAGAKSIVPAKIVST